MFRNKFVFSVFNRNFESFFCITRIKNFRQNAESYFFFNIAFFFYIKIHKLTYINHAVGYNLYFVSVLFDVCHANSCIFYFQSFFFGNNFPNVGNNFSCERVWNRTRKFLPFNTMRNGKLFIVFISSDA